MLTLTLSLVCSAAMPQEPQFEAPVRLKGGASFVKVESPGYAFPCWADADGDKKKDLVVGQFASGAMKFYKNLGGGKLAEGKWLEAGGNKAEVPGVWWCTSSTPQFVDLNADGKIDILSGCYSHDESKDGMAGFFSVFWGEKGNKWKRPVVLNGSDGAPLKITPGNGQDPDIDRICTRPTAVDLDGDGKLDIVSGNFRGTFNLFAGEGKGKFAPKSTLLTADGAPLAVQSHSDPCFVDWDRDGDLDLVTGSAQGGVFLCENSGSAKEAKFSKPKTLFEAPKREGGSKLGDEHLTGPGDDSRVCVDDVNGDGKLDLLVGDRVSLVQPAKGVTPAVAAGKLRDLDARASELLSKRPADGAKGAEAAQKKFEKDYEALQKERKDYVIDERTGFVWVLYQKAAAPVTGTR